MWGGKFREVDWVELHRANVSKTDKKIVESRSNRDGKRLRSKMEKIKAMGIDISVEEVEGKERKEELFVEEEKGVKAAKKKKKKKKKGGK